MLTRHRSLQILAVLILAAPAYAAEPGPATDVPELKVLSHYVGQWDVKINSKETPFESGEVSAVWILDGRFVQQTINLNVINSSTPLKISTMMTYDPDVRKYRFWRFVSNGNVTEASGTWDAKTKTMTLVGKDTDLTATTTASFAKEGVEEWKIVVKDSSGNDVATVSGTNTRKKD